MAGSSAPGFLPSISGLHFRNSFPHQSLATVGIPGVATLALGDAANGLCGGMSSTVRDLYEARMPPPADRTPPAGGTARFEYLVERQVESLAYGSVALRLYELGSPLLPDGEPNLGPFGLLGLVHGRATVMIVEEWPRVRADLDGGHPSLIGLVRAVDSDPRALGRDHQVLAYAYELEGTDLSISIYDPNHPDDDTIRMSLSLADPGHATPVTYAAGSPPAPLDEPTRCFIHMPYAARDPAPWR
jgi:hypothetical protein